MSWRVVVRPQASEEFQQATHWYRNIDGNLGARFVDEFAAAIVALSDNPFRYQIIFGDRRRFHFRRFPYSLIYVPKDGLVVIVACHHSRRDPAHWRKRKAQ